MVRQLILRLSGKRTLAKLNAFDMVVTVALGSTLATILLGGTVSWSEGVAAVVLESDGTLSVITAAQIGNASALLDVVR